MATISQLKAASDAAIRNKTLPKSITPANHGDVNDMIGQELRFRGLPQVESVADLINESHLNSYLILVPNYGVFKAYASVGAPDGVDTFYSADAGYLWTRIIQNPVVTPDLSNDIMIGGEVSWISGYTYNVSPSVYTLAGNPYDIPENTQITLAPADPLLDRIDMVVVDDTESVVVITGDPAENPLSPSVDPATQIGLTFIFVARNTVAPTIPNVYIYQENVEWTTLSSSITLATASTNAPAAGTVSIEATNALPAHQIKFTAPGFPNMSLYNVLRFRIRSKAAWSQLGSGLSWQFYNDAAPQGLPVLFQNNSYGFNSSTIGTYQYVVIPLVGFNSPQTVNNLIMKVAGPAGTQLGFYIDDIQLLQADIPATGGKFFEHGGNGWGHTAILGTKDNQDLSIILNSNEVGRFRTTGVFEYRGNVYLPGTNPGISYFSGTFAASDYYTKRTGTTMIVHGAGIVDLQIGQKSGVTVNSNVNRGIELYDMKSPSNSVIAQFLPSGQTSLKKYGVNTFAGIPAYGLGVTALGDIVEFTPSGAGSVTTFSAGALSPLFTTNVATASTTPALSFTLDSQAANTVFAGPTTGASAAPTFRAMVNADIAPALVAESGTQKVSGAIRLGGNALLANTTVPTSAFSMTFISSTSSAAITGNNTNGGGVLGVNTGASSLGYGIGGSSLNGAGVRAEGNNYYAIHGRSNLGVSVLFLENVGSAGLFYMQGQDSTSNGLSRAGIYSKMNTGGISNPGAAGMGIYFDYWLQNGKTTNPSGTAISRFTNYIIDPTHSSEHTAFYWSPAYSGSPANRLEIRGNGTLLVSGYGTGTITGTLAKLLGVTSAGQVIDVNPGSIVGTTYTFQNGLTEAAGVVKLGGSLTADTNISMTTSDLNFTGTTGGVTISTSGSVIPLQLTGSVNIGVGLLVAQNGSSGTGAIISGMNYGLIANATNPGGIPLLVRHNFVNTGGLLTLADYATTEPAVSTSDGQRHTYSGVDSAAGPAAFGEFRVVYTNITNSTEASSFEWHPASGGSVVKRMSLLSTGLFNLQAYGDGTFEDTFSFVLGVDTNGKVVEIDPADLTGGGGGTVTLVTGTANRITIGGSPSTSPIVDISSSYVGQTSIITLGTVTTGTWQGTTIAHGFGGTGFTSYSAGNLLIGKSDGSLAKASLTQGTGIFITNGDGAITINTWNHTVQTSTSAAYTWNVAIGENLRWTITGTSNTLAFSNLTAGRYYTVEVIQGDGNDTVSSWPAGTVWFGGIAPTLSVGAGDSDYVVFYYDGVKLAAQHNPLDGAIIPLVGGGTGASLADPGADRIMFWDDSAGTMEWLTLGTNLSITGTTINAAAGGSGVDTMAAIGASPNANGASISSTTLTLQPANASFGGVVTTGTQTFAGEKFFNDIAHFNNIIGHTYTNVGSSPAAGTGWLFAKTADKKLYWKDDTGLDYNLTDSGANTALSNLASVAINTSLISDTDVTDDLGTALLQWRSLYVGSVKLKAGTAGAGGAPVYYAAGVVLTTGVSGAINFDGKTFYAHTDTGRGITPTTSFVRLTGDVSISDVNTAQSPFGASFDVWTLAANTTYWMEGKYVFTHGATSHSVGMGFAAGTATISSIGYTTVCWVTTINTNTASQTTNEIQAASNTAVNAAGANAQETIEFRGHITIGTGGTITPQITFSAAPGGAPVCKALSYLRFTPLGADTVQSVGPVA